MRVSTVLPVQDWRACSRAAREAEEDGFDTVQTNELRHDPFAPLAFAALATERVDLVTSVAIAFPRSPMIVANQAWDINRHSGGRFVLGLGCVDAMVIGFENPEQIDQMFSRIETVLKELA